MTVIFTSSVPGQRNGIVHKNISPDIQKKLFKSIGWNEQQMNLLLQTLTTMLKCFKKISDVTCTLKIEIDQYQNNIVELFLDGSQFNLTLTRDLEPEDITSKIALAIGQKLTDYCLSQSVPGISHIIQIKPENEISSWILAQTLQLKILLTFLPNPPFIHYKFCQDRAAVFLQKLKADSKKDQIDETDLMKSIAALAMFAVIEEKYGYNQVDRKFTQEFGGELEGNLRLVNHLLDRNPDLALSSNKDNLFSHNYQELKQFCTEAYNSMKINS